MKKNNRRKNKVYGVTCLVIAMIMSFVMSCGTDHSSIYRQPAYAGEAVTFRLKAPQDMTEREFEEACRIVAKRADAFAGKGNYRMEQKPDEVILSIPEEVFAGQEDPDVEDLLNRIFAFSGQWLIHNSSMTEYLELKPEDLRSVKQGRGVIPVVTDSSEMSYFNPETIDWTEMDIYYIEMVFDDRAAAILEDFLSQEGFGFIASLNIDTYEMMIFDEWISLGDGKTAFFPIGPEECQNYADAMTAVMTEGVYSDDLELLWEEETATDWEIPDRKNAVQCAEDEFDAETVEVACELWKGRCLRETADLCKKQLEILGIPFALGVEKDSLRIRMPLSRTSGLILFTACGANMSITSRWGNEIIDSSGIRGADAVFATDKQCIEISVDPYSFNDFLKDGGELSDCRLKLDEVEIGILESVNEADRTMLFSLYLPEEAMDNVSAANMTEYICGLADAQALDAPSYSTPVFRDADGQLNRRQRADSIPAGLSNSRFQSLFDTVREQGGEAAYSIEYGEEKIELFFDQWEGNFPEEALSMVESIYEKGNIGEGICQSIHFEIHSFYEGERTEISISFEKSLYSEAVILLSGKVTCNDSSVLERASEYVDNSPVLSSADSDDVWRYVKQY